MELPKTTIYGKRLPKQTFYDRQKYTAGQKRVFVEQISQITWQNKIAPTTLNVAPGKSVKEIQVISIALNQKTLDKKALPLIDQALPYHTLFLLEHGGKVQAWIGYKEQNESSMARVGPYYHTDWLAPEALELRIDGLGMDSVYENFVRQIAGGRLDTDCGIAQAIRRDEVRQKLTKKIEALENRAMREKQPRRKWEMVEELKQMKRQMRD